MNNYKPLTIENINGELVISIGIETLKEAFEYSPYNLSKEKISDLLVFIDDMIFEMTKENEIGESVLTRFLDEIMIKTLEEGSNGIYDPELDELIDERIEKE